MPVLRRTWKQRFIGRHIPGIAQPLFIGALAAAGVEAPDCEYQFHPERRWRIDYAWPTVKLAVEIEGGIYGIGRPCPVCKRRAVAGHSSIERQEGDMEKYNALALNDWRLLRFTPDAVRNGTAVRVIKDFFDGRNHEPIQGHDIQAAGEQADPDRLG